MKRNFRAGWLALVAAVVLIPAFAAEAKQKSVSILTFTPATDAGKYISVQQSKTLPQWSFNAGMTTDFAYEPLEYADPTGARVQGIVDDLITTNIQGAIGWTDWFSTGVNIPIAVWETFYDPQITPPLVPQKETFYGKMGDVRLEMKFRLLDIDP